MALLHRFVSIFVSPTRVFDEVRDSKVGWWQPWLIVSLIFMFATWLASPLQLAVMEMSPELEGQDVTGQARVMQTVGIVMAPAMALIMTAVIAGLTYIMVTLMSKEATFKKYFALLFFCNIVFSVGYLLTIVILRLRGVENITSPEDMQMSLSLRMLAPEASAFVKGILGSIEFFSLWGLALVVVGLKHIFGLRTGQAVGCVIPLWVLYAAVSVMGEIFMNLGR